MKTWAERVMASESRSRACYHYGGCGCDAYGGCCETCPFPVCRYDLPKGLQDIRAMPRNARITELRSQGRTVQDIADDVGVSSRHVWNVLARTAKVPLTDTPKRAIV